MLRKISMQKFVHSEQYRQGVIDAIDDLLLHQQALTEKAKQNGCEPIYDRMVDLVNCEADRLRINLYWQQEWELIWQVVMHVYHSALNDVGQFKKIKNQLNQLLVDRNVRNGIKHKTRYDVLKRDCFKCCACGLSPSFDPSVVLMIDHIVPLTRGGKDSMENYQTLCQFCNAGKGATW